MVINPYAKVNDIEYPMAKNSIEYDSNIGGMA
jgi:hypothetical protein